MGDSLAVNWTATGDDVCSRCDDRFTHSCASVLTARVMGSVRLAAAWLRLVAAVPADPMNLIWIGLFVLAGLGIIHGLGAQLAKLPLVTDRRVTAVVLGALTLAGLALRLWAAGATHRLLENPAHLIGDEMRYDSIARDLLNGQCFPWPASTPVYPLFLAACYAVFGGSYAAALIVQAFVSATTVPLTYRLARRFVDPWSALVSALLVAVHPGLITQVGMLYTEAIYTPLWIATALSLCCLLEEPRLRRNLSAGAWLAVSTLCRPMTALLPLVLPLVMPRRWRAAQRVRVVAVLMGIMALTIAPWAYHNWRTQRAFLPFGFSLTMLWHGSPEFYHIMAKKPNAMLRVWDEELNPDRNGGHNPVTLEGDRYFNARALASIRAEPGVYAWYSLQKLAFFWIGHPAAEYDWPFNAWATTWQRMKYFGARLFTVCLTFLGLFVLRRHLRTFLPLLLMCGYFMVVHAALSPVARYSEPLYPILAVFIAAAAGDVAQRLRERVAAGAPAFARMPAGETS